MHNEARSASHRWVLEPDRIDIAADGAETRTRGHLFRQRLRVAIKHGWRAATWDDLDPSDPSTAEAFEYMRSHKTTRWVAECVQAFRDGVPVARPKEPETELEGRPMADIAAEVAEALGESVTETETETETSEEE